MAKFSNRSLSTIAMLLVLGTLARADGDYYAVTFTPSQEEGQLQIGVTHTLWLPPDTKTIRGILVHQHGCGTGACRGGETAAYDLHWQELARKWDCGLLGPSYHQTDDQNCRLWCDPRNGSSKVFTEALEALAEKSGHAEIARVPWCLWGHSGGGFWASLLQMEYPERIVAIWFQSGSAYSRWASGEITAPTIPAAAMEIPMMVNSGLKERDHERFQSAWNGALAMFRNYRARGAPIAFAPDPKTGHETGDSRYLAIPFFDACLAQRLPLRPGDAGPLRPMDPRNAWLAEIPQDPTITQPPPVPAIQFDGDPRQAVWLPNAQVARAWAEFIEMGTVSDTTEPSPPHDVQAKYHGPSGVTLTWQARADFESGIRSFEIQRAGKTIGLLPPQPSGRFGRPLFQNMSYHDTPQTPLPKMHFVDPEGTSADEYRVRTINGAGISSRPAPVVVHHDLQFAEVDGHPLKLNLYLPPNDPAPPLLVWIHGGGWRGGSPKHPPLRAVTKHGYALASISYRFTDKAVFPAQIHDCKAAIRWLRSRAGQYGYRADWIAAAGGSAGGHLALLLGVSGSVPELEGELGDHLDQSSRVQAIVDYYGPSDFVLRGKTQPDRAYTEKSGSYALLGGRDGTVSKKMERFASPTTYVSEDDPPLLVFHGGLDDVVLLDQSERIVDCYEAMKLKNQVVVLDASRHGGKEFFASPHLDTLLAFLRQHRPR